MGNQQNEIANVNLSASDLFDKLNAKLTKLKEFESKPYKTNRQFRFNPNYTANSPIHIDRIKDPSLLITIDSYLRSKNEDYIESAEKTFGFKEGYPAFLWQGYTYEDWQNDLVQRMNLINLNINKEQLLEAKKLIQAELTKGERLKILASKFGLT